jgi:ADP-ribosylglycohydrolase
MMNSQENNDKTKGVLFGVAIGDALGVPVEFDVRAKRKTDPVTDFRGGGTLGLPLGTFSDDSSLTFCLAEALSKDSRLEGIMRNAAHNFIDWEQKGYWAVDNYVFDIGDTTREAIGNLEDAGPADEGANGNGSLMRIAPLVFYLRGSPITKRF